MTIFWNAGDFNLIIAIIETLIFLYINPYHSMYNTVVISDSSTTMQFQQI